MFSFLQGFAVENAHVIFKRKMALQEELKTLVPTPRFPGVIVDFLYNSERARISKPASRKLENVGRIGTPSLLIMFVVRTEHDIQSFKTRQIK